MQYWLYQKKKVAIKNRQINKGELEDSLTPLEWRILQFCKIVKNKGIYAFIYLLFNTLYYLINIIIYITEKKKEMKQEPCDGEDGLIDDNYLKDEPFINGNTKVLPTTQEEKTFNIMDTMVCN